MGQRRCAADRQPFSGRPAAVYCTFFPQPGSRKAYRAYVCPDHAYLLGEIFDLEKKSLDIPEDSTDAPCPGCGQFSFDGEVVTYFDMYIPGAERHRVELWTCSPCSQQTRGPFVTAGRLLPDRDAETTLSRGVVESVWQAYH